MKSIAEILNGTSRIDDSTLRRLAEYGDWFVPVTEDSRAMLWTIDGVCHWPAQSEKMLPVEVDVYWSEMRGRHLVSVLPDEVQRVVFDWGKGCEFIIDGFDLDRLRNIATALDCEDAVSTPGLEGAVDAMRAHEWLVLCELDKPFVRNFRGLNSVCAFSAVDSLQNYFNREPGQQQMTVRSIKGVDLFDALDARSDWDCLWINPHFEFIWEIFAPGQIYDLTQQREPRAEGRILKGRTVAEIHRFLDERGMLWEDRQHSMRYVGDVLVANYSGAIIGSRPKSFNFFPVSESGSDLDWGDGATDILCTGLLSDVLRRRLEFITELPKPLSESDLHYVKVAILWARELIKTIEEGKPELSRRTQRTVDGARFVREMPHIKTRAFMEGAIQFCEDICQSNSS